MTDSDGNFETLIKLVIIGDSGVGKSNYLYRFVEGEFCPIRESTVGFDYKSKVCILPNSKKSVKFQVWDTAGQEQYMSINKNLFQRVQGIILMYDISTLSSFEHLDQWMELIQQYANNMPLILIGNKVDLESKRKVEKEKGENFAKTYDIKFFESSGKTGINVNESFFCIGEDMLEFTNKNNIKPKRGSEYVISKENYKPKKKKACC
jgi:small GTP-binding protein